MNAISRLVRRRALASAAATLGGAVAVLAVLQLKASGLTAKVGPQQLPYRTAGCIVASGEAAGSG
ncbi:MAG: hypothetical protein HY703_12300 [Gemmatimonadetes bacterium]|nr:hypothetical protein [Gemmatimonadota bacterium]